jgi:tetratricopeptide (TPR) repeat protein/transcriptional regulator with XRE-family HTH domain
MADSNPGFGARLHTCRLSAGLSQEELAQRSRLDVRTIRNLERDRARWPYPDTVRRLADALDLRDGARDEFVASAGRRLARGDSTMVASGPGSHTDARRREPVIPRELPGAVRDFVGRADEMSALSGLLENKGGAKPRTVVIPAIVGMAGVGKTALALQWARQVAGQFPDGQLYVNLRGYDPAEPIPAADALVGLLRTLGVPSADIPDGVEERARLYRSRLAARRILVLLDNARDGDQVRPLLPGDPGCIAVVTSRDALAGLVATDGAWRLDLDVLPLADAVALLRSLIGGRADDDPGAAAVLAGLCTRLPLALRIAAERVAARGPVPLAQLTADLAASRLDCLDAGEDRADVRAVFSWSCRQLPDGPADAFALLSLHPGTDLDMHAVAALTGSTAGQARKVLALLYRASLIQAVGHGRYGMHDLLRAYAREQAAANDTDSCGHQALTRLFDYYLSAAAAAMDLLFPAEAHQRPRIAPGEAILPAMQGQVGARAWLDAELANLVAVVVHAAGHGWPQHAAALAATLFRHLITGSYLPEATTIYDHALQAARRSHDLAAEASALNGLGGISLRKGLFPEAADHYRVALELYRRCGDRAGQGRVLNNLGLTEQYPHNLQSAAGYNHEAIAALQYLSGQQSAADYYREAIAAFEDAGDSLGMATTLCYLSGVEIEMDSLDQASGHLQLALQVFRDQKDRAREADALSWLGDLSLRRGQLTQAAAFHEHALSIHRSIDQPVGVAEQLKLLGDVSLRQGDYPQAISYLRQAAALFGQHDCQHGQIIALRALAQALHKVGEPAAARTELAAAVGLATETGNAYQQACAHRELAESHHAAGQDDQARHQWRQALTLYMQLGAAETDQVRSQLASLQVKQADTPPGTAG